MEAITAAMAAMTFTPALPSSSPLSPLPIMASSTPFPSLPLPASTTLPPLHHLPLAPPSSIPSSESPAFPAPPPRCSAAGAESCSSAGTSGATLVAALQFFAAAQCMLNEPWPENASLKNETCVDFIVVGGGTAGSAIAARLAEIENITVLLIEAGPDPPKDSIIPGFHVTLKAGYYDWNLTTVNEGADGASQALRGGSQSQPRGRVLGGTGSLNDMVYARGFPTDYEEWALTLGNEWNWSNVLPYFKKTEYLTDEKIINDPELMKFHGRSGPIEVSGLNASTFDTDQFLNAFKEAGFKIVKDMTNPDEIGAGRHSHTIRNGRRESSLTALLNKAAARKKNNLFVLKESLVSKIIIENNTAYGVQVLSDNKEFSFYARREVIVSAGTFNTPKLLMLSGIGPEDHLKDKNIEVVKNLPVGENLHDHVMVLNYIVADNGTCYTNDATDYMNMIRYLYDRSGPLSYVNSMAAYMALENSTQQNVPDFAFYPSCIPMGTPFYENCMTVLRFNCKICIRLNELLKDHELITVATVLMKPKSRGRVELRSVNPSDSPLIYSGTFNDPDDLKGYPEATEVFRKIAESSYFKRQNARVVELDIKVCAGLEGEELVKCKARAMAMSAWHSVGTAAMGSVVDANLRVLGVQDLRVVDASVMPKVIRGNTNAPVVMIAEKAADYIKSDWNL